MAWASVQRVVQILTVLFQHLVGYFAAYRAPWLAPVARRCRQPLERSKPDRLRVMFEDLGGSFIKLGQMLALQPDMLPEEYCNALYDLLDRVSPLPGAEMVRVFREELGVPPDAVFDRFDATPLASGSIGQIHVAWLNGRKLAVKIQRPDTRANFNRDVKLMLLLVWCVRISRLRQLEWLIDPILEFAAWAQDELDFRHEAGYMRQLRRNAVESQSASEYVPFVVSELSTRRVLVAEFLEGVTLMDHVRACESGDPAHETRLNGMNFDSDRVARHIIENCLGDVFRFGVFHADLHPGNLMILNDNMIGYVDFGITGIISKYSRNNLLAMTLAYARKDVDTLCDCFFNVSSLDATSDPGAFRDGLKRMSQHWYTNDPHDPRLKITTTQVMLDMLKISRQARIWPQRDIIKYIRSAIAIDGLIRRFAPEFDFSYHIGTVCRRYLTWHARKTMVSHDALVSGATAGVDLVRDGMFRLAGLLEHVAESARNGSVRAARDHGPPPRARFKSRFELALVTSAALALALGTHDSIQVGVNLATSELIVAAAAAVLLVRTRSAALVPLRS